jgi:plastocyanin
MRLFSLLAVLSAVLASAPAHACCIFKCFGKGSAAAMPAEPPGAQRVMPMAGPGGALIWIYTVGGYEPDSTGNVSSAVPPGGVEIVVEADPLTSWASSIDLYVTDLGAVPAPAAAVKKTAAGVKKRYKAVRSRLKLKTINPMPAAARDVVGAGDTVKWVWELAYLVATDAGHNYSAYAQGDYWSLSDDGWDLGTATSNTVTFHTGSADNLPPGTLNRPAPPPPPDAIRK